MTEHEIGNKARWRRERKMWQAGIGLSLVLHLLALTWGGYTPLPLSPFAAAGPRAHDPRAASGELQALQLRMEAPVPIVPPAVPLPEVSLPVALKVVPVETAVAVASTLAQIEQRLLSGGSGAALNAGLPGGTGRGDGGTAAAGRFRVTPPSPRGMIVPPNDKSLRGREIQIWVFVDERGRVVPDSTRLFPSLPDAGLARRLKAEAAEWVFEPARRGETPVAAWFPYTISG
ncbi:MAG: hypothetical protein HY701_13350 [Gemmatimonadetes bacterium]|nr:hypothetical protein [Gemmatimonadota bacterium]